MRRQLLALVVAVAAVASAPAASAAPTCLRPDGVAARCGIDGVMPVGWQPTPEQERQWRLERPPEPLGFQVFGAFILIAGMMAIIAGMPDFDGWSDDDWDEQEGEPRRRRR